MARPRSFDIDQALDRAMHLFWERGYEATSLKDLTEALGIRPPSFYQAFGSKRELYLRAIDHYAIIMGRQLSANLAEDGRPLSKRLRTLFYQVAEESARKTPSKGCLLVNATVERASHDEAVRQRVHDRFLTNRAYFAGAIVNARDAGESFRSDVEPLALTLVNLYHGLRVTGKAQATEQEMRQIVDTQLLLL